MMMRCLWRGMVGMMHWEMCNSVGRTRAFWKVFQRVALGTGRSLRLLAALGGVLAALSGVLVATGPNVWPSIFGSSSSTSNTRSATTNETGSALGTHTTKHVHTLYSHGGCCQGWHGRGFLATFLFWLLEVEFGDLALCWCVFFVCLLLFGSLLSLASYQSPKLPNHDDEFGLSCRPHGNTTKDENMF